MSRQEGTRPQPLRFRLPSWASAALQRGPTRRQPSRVTTTAAEPSSSPPGRDQPQQQPRASPSPAQVRPPAQHPQSSPAAQAKMGAAPSRSSSSVASPGDPTLPRSQPGEIVSQPPSRTPSRQSSLKVAPQSPPLPSSRPASWEEQQETAASSPPPPSSTATRAGLAPPSPARPEAQSATTTSVAAQSTGSVSPPPSAEPPSSPPWPTAEEISEAPPPSSSVSAGSPSTERVLDLQPEPTVHKRRRGLEEEAATEPDIREGGSKGTDQTRSDLQEHKPVKVEKQSAPRTGDGPSEEALVRIKPQNPETETEPEKGKSPHLTPTEDADQKQTAAVTRPARSRTEGAATPASRTLADRGSESRLGQSIEGKPEEAASKIDHHSLRNSEKEPKSSTEETPKTSPESAPDGKPQNDYNRPATKMVATEQTIEKPGGETDRLASEVAPQVSPLKEVKAPEAEQREKQDVVHPENEQTQRRMTKGKEGKVEISAVARASSSGDRQSSNLQKEIREGISRLVQGLAVQHSKHEDGGGHGISIITLAGENHGATMHAGYGTISGREGHDDAVNKVPIIPNAGKASATAENGRKKADEACSIPAMATSVNSNVQTINGSILHDSCCSDDNPGVHLVVSNGARPESAEATDAHKPRSSRVSSPPRRMVTQEAPAARRRCLRSLFLESSGDDTENPRRRHGCRYASSEGKKGPDKGGGGCGGSVS